MKFILANWFITALAILGTAYILPGISVSGFVAALMAAVVLGFVNALIRPILILLTLPVTVLTLGLFLFVINALLLLFVSVVMGNSFVVDGFFNAVIGSFLISFINSMLHWLLET
ncbi:MAG: phage holin family protein [Gemmatimonadetes bacterium]|nr:MAG: phage holin family protein [Gemmatimonadota bacterium]